MRSRYIKFALLIALIASACSTESTQEMEIVDSEILKNNSIVSTSQPVSDSKTYDDNYQTEAFKEETLELSEIQKNTWEFSIDFSEQSLRIDRGHPFQSIEKFCRIYSPIKEEILPATVQVKKGESLAIIASRHDLTLEEILEMNEIANPNLIFVGQEIRIGEEIQTGIGPQATGRGITEDSIIISYIRTDNSELAIHGFEDFRGDLSEIFSSFVKILNEDCGGFHGRKIDLREVLTYPIQVSEIDTSTLGNIACLDATKEIPAVIVVDISGFSGSLEKCVVDENKTALISSKVLPSKYFGNSDGRLLLDNFSAEQAFSLMLDFSEENNLLSDKSIAIVADDTLEEFESVFTGLVEPLRKLNYNPSVYLLSCEGGIFCNAGIEKTIEGLTEKPPDVLFPLLNPISLPELLTQMIQNDLPKPQIIQSGFNQQDDEIATNHIFNYGGAEVANYYNGSLIISHPYVEDQRVNDGVFSDFEDMCLTEYSRISNLDQHTIDYRRTKTILRVCSVLRYIARALYDSGINPSRRKIHETLSNLESVDTPGLPLGSFHSDKPTMPSSIQKMEYKFPCVLNKETELRNQYGCIISTDHSESIYRE